MRTLATCDQGSVEVDRKPVCRSPCWLTQTPIRSSRSAPVITTVAMAAHVAAPATEPAIAMTMADSRTNEASNRNTAASPTRQVPGR